MHHEASLHLARNSVWNLVALFATVAVHFVTVPIVVSRIGLAEFGNAGLVLALWAPLLLVGTVVGQALTRELGSRLPEHGPEYVRRMVESGALIWVLSTLALGGLMLALGPWLLRALTGVGPDAAFWRPGIAIAGVGWATQQGSLILQGVSLARQDYRTMALVTVAASVVSVVAILAATATMSDSRGYLAGLSAGFVASQLIWLIVVGAFGKAGSIVPRVHRAELRELFAFSKWQGVVQFAGVVGNQIDRYALGAMAPATVIGQYNAAKRPQEAAYSVAWKLAEVLFPFFASQARSDPGLQARFYLFASWAVMTCGAVILGPMISLADPIMRVWVGPEVANGGAQLMRTLVLGGLIGCGSNVFAYYLMGIGRNRPVAAISLLYSLLTIALSILFVHRWGPYAAGAGLVVASVVRVAASLGVLKQLFFRFVPLVDLVCSTIVPLAIGAAVAYAWRMVPLVGHAGSWAGIAGAYLCIAASILAAGCLAAAMTAFGRSALAGTRGLLRRIITDNVS